MDDDNAFEEWLQAALEKEREATKLLLEERDRQTQRLMEEERARNNAQTKAMYDLFAVSHLCTLAKRACMYISLLITNMLASSKTNLQAMCEKHGMAPPPPMPSPVGTVSSLSMINIARSYTIECRRANHILQLIPCCSIIPELHPTILLLLLVRARPTQLVLLVPEVAFGKFFFSYSSSSSYCLAQFRFTSCIS